MMINVGLLEQAWGYAQEHPEQYSQDAWGVRRADGTAAHDIAGLALKLLGARFVWSPAADYPPCAQAPVVWGATDIVFSSLPRTVTRAVVDWVIRMPADRCAAGFWHAVTSDRCPVDLAARVALGLDSSDALVLFEEDATPMEVQRAVAGFLRRGRAQWEKAALDAAPAGQVDPARYLVACLESRGTSVKVVHA